MRWSMDECTRFLLSSRWTWNQLLLSGSSKTTLSIEFFSIEMLLTGPVMSLTWNVETRFTMNIWTCAHKRLTRPDLKDTQSKRQDYSEISGSYDSLESAALGACWESGNLTKMTSKILRVSVMPKKIHILGDCLSCASMPQWFKVGKYCFHLWDSV